MGSKFSAHWIGPEGRSSSRVSVWSWDTTSKSSFRLSDTSKLKTRTELYPQITRILFYAFGKHREHNTCELNVDHDMYTELMCHFTPGAIATQQFIFELLQVSEALQLLHKIFGHALVPRCLGRQSFDSNMHWHMQSRTRPWTPLSRSKWHFLKDWRRSVYPSGARGVFSRLINLVFNWRVWCTSPITSCNMPPMPASHRRYQTFFK